MIVAMAPLRARIDSVFDVAASPAAGCVSATAWGRVAVRGGGATNDNENAAVLATLIVCLLGMWIAAVAARGLP